MKIISRIRGGFWLYPSRFYMLVVEGNIKYSSMGVDDDSTVIVDYPFLDDYSF